jgi:hypothetical protein
MGLILLTAIANGTLADATVVTNNFGTLQNLVNGQLDNANIAPSLLAQMGASDPANVRSGGVIIPTTESRTNVAYGLMPTPDRVSSIVLPTPGILEVWFQATWQESVALAARAAIFLGANQLRIAGANATFVEEALTSSGTPNIDAPLSSFPPGLWSMQGAAGYAGDVSTGQAFGMTTGNFAISTSLNAQFIGGPCYIFLNAGTYDVSVQFKSSSGSVTVKNRRLYVKAIGF